MAHIVTKCSCGAVITSMIVCFDFTVESSTTIVEKGCHKCKAEQEEANGERTREG